MFLKAREIAFILLGTKEAFSCLLSLLSASISAIVMAGALGDRFGRRRALLTGLAMLTALLGSMTLLPKLILTFKPLGK